MGYSLIMQRDKQLSLLRMGVLKLKQYDNQALKLKKIFERVLEIIDEYHPDELAIEAPFFGKNVQSMLKLGRAQGVAMAAALYRDIPIFEYSISLEERCGNAPIFLSLSIMSPKCIINYHFNTLKKNCQYKISRTEKSDGKKKI